MLDYDYYFEIDQWTNSDDRPWLFFLSWTEIENRIQTVKLKILGKLVLKVGCRTSVTFKL